MQLRRRGEPVQPAQTGINDRDIRLMLLGCRNYLVSAFNGGDNPEIRLEFNESHQRAAYHRDVFCQQDSECLQLSSSVALAALAVCSYSCVAAREKGRLSRPELGKNKCCIAPVKGGSARGEARPTSHGKPDIARGRIPRGRIPRGQEAGGDGSSCLYLYVSSITYPIHMS